MGPEPQRQLLIIRHAKAEAPWGTPDRDRALTERGVRQARRQGEELARRGLIPDGAVVSDAMRTRGTYAGLASAWGEDAPSAYLDARLYEASAAGLISVINETPETVRRLALVAHQPAVQEAAMRLASVESDEAAVWAMASDFGTADVCVFDVRGEWATLDGRDATLRAFIEPGC